MLKTAINAQILPGGGSGGVEQVLIGLVYALGKLEDGEEEYVLVTHPRKPDWLKPYMGKNMHIVPRPGKNWNERARAAISPFKQAIKPVAEPLVKPLLKKIRARRWPQVVQSNGFWESLGVDVIHFPYQSFVISQIPSVYNPHDLQHLHFPEFFTPGQIRAREITYRAGCRYAEAVAVHSKWVKEDIIHHYGTEPEKVFVIPWGPPTDAYEPASEEMLSYVRQKFSLPQSFILYPAQTWPHKNHIRLLEAIALLREQGNLTVNLVCTGRKNAFGPSIVKRIRELALENQSRFLGFVDATELRALYRLAQFVVIPTLFEAGSAPMLEAWREGTPVACSAVTSLPEQGGDAALFFEPTSIESIAEAIYRMATDSELRETLRQQGAGRIQLFAWERSAKTYRALYRKLAGHALTKEDKALLDKAMLTQPLFKKGNEWRNLSQ